VTPYVLIGFALVLAVALGGIQAALDRLTASVRGLGVRHAAEEPSLVFGERYGYSGWHDGGEDCYPAEPGKEWITIGPVDEDGYVTDEVAVIVLRTDGVDPNLVKLSRARKEYAAATIVAALNNEPVVYPAGGVEGSHA
jgi:hypothetical protein